MRTLVALCAAVLGIGAQPAVEVHADPSSTAPDSSGILTPEGLLLARIKLHMMDTLRGQPNYTCLETVERSHRDGYTRKYQLEDTLRIEVALVDGKEMFAWPGSKQFEDKDIRELVPTGTFGTGDFALHARSVFGGNVASFDARGEEKMGESSALRYDFRVPRPLSGYRIRTRDAQTIVGYHGSFWVDPASLDVRRLEIIVDDPPAVLKLKSVDDRMDYARIKIGDGDFLLPDSSEVVLVDIYGVESRNRVRFTACHQYTGQSVLSFDDPGPAADSKAAAAKLELELPRNLEIALSLIDEIDDTSAVGDPLRAQLHDDLKVRGRVLLPKGAVFSGRISRMERHQNYIVLGLMFSEADSATAHASLELQFDRVMGLMDGMPRNRWLANTPALEHEGVFAILTGRLRLGRGILIFWRT